MASAKFSEYAALIEAFGPQSSQAICLDSMAFQKCNLKISSRLQKYFYYYSAIKFNNFRINIQKSRGFNLYFHFETLRTYTASLLALFADLEVQAKHSNNKIHVTRIPIQYSNREKSDIVNQLSYEQIFSANSQILPRAVLTFVSMAPARERAKNKFNKIFQLEVNGEKKQFQYNSIPYNFEYQVIAQTRGMNEACQIIEQVCAHFNPSYNMKIKEVPFQSDFTSVKLDLTDTTIEQQDIDDYSANIVTITFNLTLCGNLYPAIKDSEIIKTIQIFLSNDEGRVSSIHSTENESIINKYNTTITGITAEDDKITAHIDNQCEKLIKYNFEWYINDALLPQSSQTLTYAFKNEDIIKVRAYTDLTSSDFYEIQASKIDTIYNINVTNIIYEDGYLKPEIKDLKPSDTHYSYEWFINDEKQDTNKETLKYQINTKMNIKNALNSIKVRVSGDDGRVSEIFEKFFN